MFILYKLLFRRKIWNQNSNLDFSCNDLNETLNTANLHVVWNILKFWLKSILEFFHKMSINLYHLVKISYVNFFEFFKIVIQTWKFFSKSNIAPTFQILKKNFPKPFIFLKNAKTRFCSFNEFSNIFWKSCFKTPVISVLSQTKCLLSKKLLL